MVACHTGIETNFTKTTVKSIETVLEGTLAAQNISTTPSNDYIPQADGTGKLDVGWMPSTIDADKLDGNHASAFLGATAQAVDSAKLDGKAASVFGRPVFLTTPLTSTDWDGDNKSAINNGTLDLSALFGVPAGVKAVLMSVQTTGNAVNDYLRFGPDSTYNYTLICRTTVANVIAHAFGIVPCDSNGDIYAYMNTVEACYIYIWGYWL